MCSKWKIPIFNYLPNLKGQELYVSGCEGIIRLHFSELKHLPKSTRYSYLEGSAVPLDLLLELCNQKELEHAFQNFKEIKARGTAGVALPKFLTKDLAYLVGALRDGSISKRKTGHTTSYTLAISQSGKGANEWMKNIQKIFHEQFAVRPKIEAREKEVLIKIFSKPVVLFFEKVFEMPNRQAGWETPNLILKSRITWPHYIAGFFDAEGYCPSPSTLSKTKKYKLKLTQTNKESLDFIKKALKKLRIKAVGPYQNKNRKTHDLFIYGHQNCRKFYDLIPLVRKKKNLSILFDPP